MSRRHSKSAQGFSQTSPAVHRSPGKLALKPITLAVHAMLIVGMTSFAAQAQAQAPSAGSATSSTSGVRSYDIPAGPLQTVLTQFSTQSGIYLAGSLELAQGKSSPGLQGNFSAQEGLRKLLAGTGLETSRTANGQYLLHAIQTTNGAATLPAVQVTGDAIDPSERFNPRTTVGSKIPMTQKEIPQTVDVVTQERIQQQNAQSLDEVLKRTPGVYVYQSDADRVQYYARGYPISAMQIDGVPIATNPNLSGTASTNSPSMAMYDRVEVLDGPAGLYGGFGNPGGAVNLVRKHAPSEYQFLADIGGGTGANWLGTIDAGGPINEAGTLRGRFIASGQTQHLTQNGTWRNDHMFYGTLEADLSSNTLLRVGASYSQRNSNVGWANATPIYDDGTPVAGRSKNFGTSWNHDQYTYTDIFATLEHKLNSDWKLSANVDYTHNTGRVYSGELFGTVDRSTQMYNFGTTNKDMKDDNVSLDLHAAGDYSLFGLPSQATFGGNYANIRNKTTTYYGSSDSRWNITSVNAFDANYPEQSFSGDPEDTSKTTATYKQYGIYGNTRIKLRDSLALILGSRISWFNYSSIPDAVYNPFGGSSSRESYRSKITPYGGLVYDINKTYSTYVSYASIFQPQYLLQRSGEPIAPIQGKQYEIGLKGSYLDGRVNTSAALFWLEQSNRAELDPNDPESSHYISAGRARTRGIDLRLSGELAKDWTVFAGYTLNVSTLLDKNSYDTDASSFSQIAPKHLFKVWTNYRLPDQLHKWEIGGGVNATSALWYDGGTYVVRQGGYYTVDARVAYQISKNLSASLNVTNLLNRTYYQPIYEGAVYSPGRQAMLMLHAKF